MNANFDASISFQSTIFFVDMKIKMLEEFVDFSKAHKNAARCMGLPVALCLSLVDFAQSISTIAEALIKGIANIFGSLFSEDYQFLRGLRQITVEFPLYLFACAVLWPLKTMSEIATMPFKMEGFPISALEVRKNIVQEERNQLNNIVM